MDDMIDKDSLGQIMAWIKVQHSKALTEGKGLSLSASSIAEKAGVKHVEKVRVLYVDSIDLSELMHLEMSLKSDEILGRLAGLTLGYTIVLDKRASETVLFHELRHVAQFELFEDLGQFVKVYLNELIKFGHGDGPLEKDAYDFVQGL